MKREAAAVFGFSVGMAILAAGLGPLPWFAIAEIGLFVGLLFMALRPSEDKP